MYHSKQFTMAEIAASRAVTPMTIYRNIRADPWSDPYDDRICRRIERPVSMNRPVWLLDVDGVLNAFGLAVASVQDGRRGRDLVWTQQPARS